MEANNSITVEEIKNIAGEHELISVDFRNDHGELCNGDCCETISMSFVNGQTVIITDKTFREEFQYFSFKLRPKEAH